jgi:hypothetical protein
LADGLALTGYFLTSRVLEPRELALPESRVRLVERLTRDFDGPNP